MPARPACPYCGAAVSAESRYCDRCGTPLQPTTAAAPSRRRTARPDRRMAVWAFVLVLLVLFSAGTAGGYRFTAGAWPNPLLVASIDPRHDKAPDLTVQQPIKETSADIANYLRSVVTINARGHGDSWGSGFIIDKLGHVVTAAHVIEGSGCVGVTDDNGRIHQGTVLSYNTTLDVAVLHVPGLVDWTAQLEFAPGVAAATGDTVYVLGSPKGVGSSVHLTATVNHRGRDETIEQHTVRNLIQFSDAVVMAGTSGGPLVSKTSGKVVGVVVASGAPAAVAWARPADDIAAQVADWAKLTPNTSCEFTKTAVTTPVTLVTITPRSGSVAVEGEDLADGAELAVRDAVDQLQAAGYVVSVVRMDDKGSSTLAREKATEAANDPKVIGVVGSLENHTTFAIAEALRSSGIPLVSPTAGAEDLTARGWGHFSRIVANSNRQEQALATVVKQLKANSVLIIDDGTPEAARKVATFKFGAQIIAVPVAATVKIGATPDIAEIKKRLLESNAQAIYFAGKSESAFQIVKALRADGVMLPFLGDQSLSDLRFRSLTGAGAEGVYFTRLTEEPSDTFRRHFETVWGKPTRGYAAYGYDAATVILRALLHHGETNPGKMPAKYDLAYAVRETRGQLGYTTNISFDRQGENITSWMYVYQWKQGTPELYVKLH